MLYPQINRFRTVVECSGIWKFKTDPDRVGEHDAWYQGFDSNTEIAVPGSWNEQLEELGLFNYVGLAWFATTIFVPDPGDNRRVWLRIGSADFDAKVWINGSHIGDHRGGFLPFEFEITSSVQRGTTNCVVLQVSNELDAESIPQGISAEDFLREGRLREETFPPARFDFFPYGGIHRPVVLHTTPFSYLDHIRVDTKVRGGGKGSLFIRVSAKASEGRAVRCSIKAPNGEISAEARVVAGAASLELVIDHCRFWSPDDPYLYLLHAELVNGGDVLDSYDTTIGVREISIEGGKLLLNGSPIYLKGFGRHEDFPVLGKAFSLPLVVKDFGLMKWIHANSFRTSHYPYADEIMAMADRQGFLVIDEVPAVSLDLRRATEKTIAAHKQYITDLIDRDYNHPSVIMWALGNEPNLVGEEGYLQGSGRKYWGEIFAHARSLDTSRPMTVPNCTRAGLCDPVFEYSDIITINRYYGWYEFPGRLEHGVRVLEQDIETIHQKFGKPIMMTEFGADTISGLHSTGDQMFTEEYQEKLLQKYIELLRSKEFVVGEHVWNFADFRTPQHFRRVLLNMKGVFTRTREPKAAAFALKKLWSSSTHPE